MLVMSACARPVLAAFCAMIIALASAPAATDVPQVLSYQGKLTDSSGLPVADGIHTLTFAVYSAETRGSLLWIENGRKVQVSGGLFSVLLGEVEPLPAGGFPSDAWLETRVGDTVLSPRLRLASTPFALRAHSAENVAPGAAVTSLNSLTGAVNIAAGDNLSLTQTGDTITLSGESIPNPLPVSQSGAWNVGITGTPTVITPTQGLLLPLWASHQSIPPAGNVYSANIQCGGYREVRLMIRTTSEYADRDKIRINVRFQMSNGGFAVFGTSNMAAASAEALTNGVFSTPAIGAMFIIPVMAPVMAVEIVNERAANTGISMFSTAYLVN